MKRNPNIVAKANSQKFIGRNRAPRVQIEYDVEVYGTQKKVQIPFVMGVMADLSGDNQDALPQVDDRKFVDIDADNFEDRMRATRPAVSINVPNRLTGEGSLAVDF
jgi:type VI secretion system protein ImpB